MLQRWQRWKGIMKCYPFEEKRLKKWQPPYIIQPKYDGIRCKAVPVKNSFILLSSEENIIYSVPHINLACTKQLPSFLEFDGELYVHGMSFEEIVSITSRTKNIHHDFSEIHYHIFDVITNHPQGFRTNLISKLDLKPPLIKTPFYLAYNIDDVMKYYYKILNDGYEGIIIRDLDAPYERKRSPYIMKFKPKQSDTYKILSYEEEISINGVPKNTLGSLTLSSQEGDIFSVGSGFTQEQRQNLWSRKEELIGKYARIEYQHLTNGRKVPRFPVFVEIVDEVN